MQDHPLVKLANTKMPFGKYQGRYLIDLPEPYLVWFRQNGFPPDNLADNWKKCSKSKSMDWNI
jgi:uncharacterized protein